MTTLDDTTLKTLDREIITTMLLGLQGDSFKTRWCLNDIDDTEPILLIDFSAQPSVAVDDEMLTLHLGAFGQVRRNAPWSGLNEDRRLYLYRPRLPWHIFQALPFRLEVGEKIEGGGFTATVKTNSLYRGLART